MKFVLMITGPTGAGKTTIARKLAKLHDKCVNIDVDHVKHFIVNGFIYDETPEGNKQWELLGDNLGLLARNFTDSGYNVIINGFIGDPAFNTLQRHIELTHEILLLPGVNTVIQRDSDRAEDIKMGKKAVKQHHNHFSTSDLYADFLRLDTANDTVDETVSKISKIIMNESK